MAIAAGDRHSLAVQADGSVWAWGDAGSGKLGTGGSQGGHASPVQISFTNATAVAAGYQHSLVLKSDGTVWAFGDNAYGQLGDGTTSQRSSAVQVVGLTGVVAIAIGRESSYALQADGASGGMVWAWGRNQFGQLGDGSTIDRLTPVKVTGVSNASAIAAAKTQGFALAIGGDGRVHGWGENDAAQLGIGHTATQLSASPLPAIVGARVVAAGGAHGASVDGAARSWVWGSAYSGALGIGPVAIYQLASVPQESDIGGVLAIAGGSSHTLAITPSGAVRGFGDNYGGKLGDGTTSQSIEGVDASGLSLADNTFLAGDQDQDDLVTWREYLAGSDPLNADTNGNGILDGHDLATGASALDPDTDDDGVPNWIEEKNGTDPFRVDTDGDGVSDLNDAFPLDPTRSMAPSANPSDTTPPVVTLKEPVSARPIP